MLYGVHMLVLLYTVRVAVRMHCAAEIMASCAMLATFTALYVPAATWYFENMA